MIFYHGDTEQIVGRERRERVSQLVWYGGGCFDSRRRVNSTVRRLIRPTLEVNKMKKETQELSRREMLTAMAVSTLGGITATAMTKKPAASRSSNSTKSRLIKIDAKPAPIAIDTAKTAVIVVDMENDFGSKGGMFDLAGIDISMIQKALRPTAKVLAAARSANIKVVYLKMGFRPDLSDLGAPDSVNRTRHLQIMHVGKTVQAPDGRTSRILIRDNWGTEIVPIQRLLSNGSGQRLEKTWNQASHLHRMYYQRLRGFND